MYLNVSLFAFVIVEKKKSLHYVCFFPTYEPAGNDDN